MATAIFSFGGKKYELSDCINKSFHLCLPTKITHKTSANSYPIQAGMKVCKDIFPFSLC